MNTEADMRKTILVALVAFALAACSSGGDDDTAAVSTTTEATTTTTTLEPEAAFMADVEAQTSGGGDDTDQLVSLGWSICGSLDAVGAAVADDAPNDSPQTDDSIAVAGAELGLDTVMSAGMDDDLTAVVMRAAGANLCPAHETTVDTYLAARGF